MDSMWGETQSSNRMDIATQLPYSTGRFGSETPFYSKMDEIPHRLNTLRESSSHWVETHEETQSFQSDSHNRMPLHVLHYPFGFNTGMEFQERGVYQVPSSHNKIPLIYADNTPGVTCLDSKETPTRMPSYGTDKQPYSHMGHQSHQAGSNNGISPHQTDNPRKVHPDNIPRGTCLDAREAQARMLPYRVVIRPDLASAVEAHEARFTKAIPSYPMDNPREMYSDINPASLDPRKAQRRMPPFGVGRQSDSDNISKSHQGRSINGIPCYHSDNPTDIHPDKVVDTDEMHGCKMNGEKETVSAQEATNRKLNRAESETPSYQISRSREGISLYQTEFQEEALIYQADAGTYEKMKTSNHQTNANGTKSLDQAIISEQMTLSLAGRKTCPLCHCPVETQPQPSYLPSLNFQKAHVRPSVIMVPVNRKLEKTEETLLTAAQDQEWTARRETQTENEDIDSSGEDEDNEEEEKRYFRVNIDGTTARFKLTKEDWARMPVKSFLSGGRLLSGHWTRIFANKVKESNPWCSVRFKNNHVRSANSRKIHSAVFFRGAAECKHLECNVKIKFVIRKEYGKYVEVTYVGNVCHRDQPDEGRRVTESKGNS